MSYGYNSSNAASFNQLVQSGIDTQEAATQSGVSLAASSYGYGKNSNLGSVIPGAGGTTDASGLTQVSYDQSATGDPAQQPNQTSTPVAASGFGYGTGINNPSVQPITTPAQQPNQTVDPAQALSGSQVQSTSPARVEPNQTVDPAQALSGSQVQSTTPARVEPNQTVDPAQALSGSQVQSTSPARVEPNQTVDPAQALSGSQVQSTTPAAVEQNDAETARLARLDLAATPNQSNAETNRLTALNAQADAGKLLAQRQQVLATQAKAVNNSDWRLRLSLAPGADYLYNATPNGILWPLKQTGGVIFPYTPKITTNYTANYSSVDLTHSNYKNYFYQNSNVGEISIEGKFTAQDTNEAQYLLAVIHFFRSVTRMFYGQDAQRGAPPPLLFLTGFGEYQFNQHPCLVSSFTYSMPDNVDYIRARSINANGANLLTRRTRQNSPTDPISGAVQRISNLFSSQGISPGAIVNRPAPPTLGQNNPTYVPTMIDISLRLLPVQSRTQVSQQFSVKGFANGDLIKGGFW